MKNVVIIKYDAFNIKDNKFQFVSTLDKDTLLFLNIDCDKFYSIIINYSTKTFKEPISLFSQKIFSHHKCDYLWDVIVYDISR